jgi:membrane protease YdiL (CAAX protease family)
LDTPLKSRPVDSASNVAPPIAIALALIVAAASLFGGSVVASLLLGPASGNDLVAAIAQRAVLYLFLFAPLYAFAFIAIFGWEQRIQQKFALPLGSALAAGGGIGLVLFAGTLLLAFVAGVIRPGASTSGASALGIIFAAGLTVWQAGAEEYLFRGWLQPILTRSWGALPGIIAAAVAFTIPHAFLQLPSGLALFNTFLAGCVFGAIALTTGRVSSAIAAHAVWNWLEQSVAGLTPNPGVDSLSSVVDLDLVGPSLISGGQDGLTGSIATTLVLGLSFAALAALTMRRINSRGY